MLKGARIVLLLLLAASRVSALDPDKAITQYRHVVWGAAEGIEGFSINRVLESGDGYIWIATDEGLVRFDGVRFVFYNSRTAPELVDDNVICLAEDREGDVWFGTLEGGLYVMKRDSFVVRRRGTAEELGGVSILALHVDRDGALWIGVRDHGPVKLTGAGFQRYPVPFLHGQGLNAVQAFYERSDGTLFFGYEWVYEHRPGSEDFRKISDEAGFIHSFIEEGDALLAATTAGVISVGSANAGPPLGGVTAGKYIRSLLKDHDGNYWIGTEGEGVIRYAGGRISTFTMKDGLSSNRVLGLYEDRSGNIWITTRGGGLNRLSESSITVFGTREGLPNDYITTVFEDSRGTWWVGTRGSGLVMLCDGAVTGTVTSSSGLTDSIVRAITEGPEGTIWVGSQRGLHRLAVDREHRITSLVRYPNVGPRGQWDPSLRALLRDREGRIWIGMNGWGMEIVEGGVMRPVPPFNGGGVGSTNIHVIYQDRGGAVWVGTHDGLFRVAGDSVRHYSIGEGLKSSLVYSLHEDEAGALWIGTYGGGLHRLKGGRIASITTRQGLFDDVVYAILDDSLGSFWMSCNRGIFRTAKRDINDVADGTAPNLACEVLGIGAGLRSVECNGGSQPAAVRTRDGRLLFPTMKGLVVVDPSQRLNIKSPVTPRVESMWIDSLRFSLSAEQRLPVGIRTLEFRYTAFGAVEPEQLRFQYRLDGFEQEWVDGGVLRRARYTNVPPGNYTFSVRTRIPGGAWSTVATSASVVIPPYVHETWWFRALAGLLLAGSIGFLVRYVSARKARQRIRQLEHDHALELERTRIARDMHDELGASLTQITVLSDLLERNLRAPEAAEPFVRTISSTARDVVASLDEIVWFVNPRHDSLKSLLPYIRAYVADYLDSIGISCTFSFPEAVPSTVQPADFRRNIFLAVKEAVTNIAKHAGATSVTVTARQDGETLEIQITDNGRGFSPAESSAEADGLKNMEKRLRDIGGAMHLRSRPGTGTTVTLRAPVKGGTAAHPAHRTNV